MTEKTRIASCSLAGCFGCHMSLLDIDERIVELVELVEFDRMPLTDIKTLGECAVGIIEGGVCNAENVETLRSFRSHCKTLVSMGACAITGGIPALRNHYSVEACLHESYLEGMGVTDPQIPDDPELPLLLDKVYPIHEVVKVDYFLPGCPPRADAIWTFLTELLSGRSIVFPYTQIHYD